MMSKIMVVVVAVVDNGDGDNDDGDEEEKEDDEEDTFSLLRFEDEVGKIRSYCVTPIEAAG